MTGTTRHPEVDRLQCPARPNCDCSRDYNTMLQNPLFDVPMGADTDAPHMSRRITACPITTLVHQMAASLGKAIDAKDTHTLAHSEEVAVMAQALALRLGLDHQTADRIHVAGHLHDIGKIGVPDHILGKPGPLTPEEWIAMRAHPTVGAAILTPLSQLVLTGVVAMVRAHHERFDGQGYPDGLAGDAIPLGARIIAVADSLSAMTQVRPYRSARAFDEAIEEIRRGCGSQFDPVVATVCLDIRAELRDCIAGYRCVATV